MNNIKREGPNSKGKDRGGHKGKRAAEIACKKKENYKLLEQNRRKPTEKKRYVILFYFILFYFCKKINNNNNKSKLIIEKGKTFTTGQNRCPYILPNILSLSLYPINTSLSHSYFLISLTSLSL